MISVAVSGSALPARMKIGTPPPTAKIDEEFGRDKCFNGQIGFDAGHRLIARILAANDMRRIERADRLQQGCFLFPNGIAFLACRRVHRQAGEHLQHVVLKHVADSASLIVEFTTVLDTKFLGHGDLNTIDVNAVPDRLEHGIRKSRIKNVLNRLLAKIVINPEDVFFWKKPVEDAIRADAPIL